MGEHPCRSMVSIKLLCNFIEIAVRHGCSPVNLLHIFRTLFHKNTSGGLLLENYYCLKFVEILTSEIKLYAYLKSANLELISIFSL